MSWMGGGEEVGNEGAYRKGSMLCTDFARIILELSESLALQHEYLRDATVHVDYLEVES